MINGGYPETPDAWIERTPEDSLPDPADCCPVCGTYQDCVCPDDAEDEPRITRADIQTTGEKIPYFGHMRKL